MSDDVMAALAIRIDSSDAKKGVDQLGKLEGAAEKAETASGDLEKAFAATMQRLQGLNAAMKALEQSTAGVGRFAEAAARVGTALPDAGAFGPLVDGVQRLNRELSRVPREAPTAAQAVQQVAKATETASAPVSRLSAGLAGMAGQFLGMAAVAGAMKSAAQEALGFSTAMAQVSTLLDGEQMRGLGALEERVRALGVEFGRAPTEQAKALYEVIASGAAEGARATEVLAVANKLATGGVTDMQTAASGLTTIWASYGSQLKDVTEASDVLFVAAAAGKTSVEDMSRFMGQVTPIAAQTGVSLDELGAAMGALTAAGIKTSTATEGLRAILAAVLKPSEQAVQLAGSLGIEFNAAGLQARGLAGFLEHLREKTGGSATLMAQLTGGVEALLPTMVLTGTGAKAFADTLEDMGTKAGRTEAAFQKMASTPQAKLNELTARFDDLQVSVGSGLLDALGPGLDALNRNFGTLTTTLGGVAQAMAVLTAAKVAGWATEGVRALATKTGAALATRDATIQAALAEAGYTRTAGESARASLRNALAKLEARAAALQAVVTLDAEAAAHTRAALAANADAQAQTRAAMAMTASGTAARGFSAVMGALGGPVGLAVTAIGLAVAAFQHFSAAAEEAREEAKRFAQESAATASRGSQIVADLEEQTRALTDAAQATSAFNIAKTELMALGWQHRALLTDEVDTVEELRAVFEGMAGQDLGDARAQVARLNEELATTEQRIINANRGWFAQGVTDAAIRSAEKLKSTFKEALDPLNAQLSVELQRIADVEKALGRVRAAAGSSDGDATDVQRDLDATVERLKAEQKAREGAGAGKRAKEDAQDRERLAKASDDYVRKLEEEARQAGLTGEAAKRQSDEYRALSAAQRERADAALTVLERTRQQEEAEKALAKATEERRRKEEQAQEAAAREVQQVAERLDTVGQAQKQLAVVQRAFDAGRISVAAYREEVARLQLQMDSGFALAHEVTSAAFRGLESAFVDFATTGELAFDKMVSSILADLARMMASRAFQALANAVLDALAPSGGGGDMGTRAASSTARAISALFNGGQRASGGPVRSGHQYLVGEKGPELFVPHGSGTIMPNRALGGGGGHTFHLTTVLQSDGTTRSEAASGASDADSQRYARLLNDVVKRELLRQLEPGGILYNARRG